MMLDLGAAVADLVVTGQIERAETALARGDDTESLSMSSPLLLARIAVERSAFAVATDLLDEVADVDRRAADILFGDVLARSGPHDDHYELVFRLARTYPLRELERGILAVQAGELAVLAGNENLAGSLLNFALDRVGADPLLQARAVVGCTVAGLVAGVGRPCEYPHGAVGDAAYTPAGVLRSVADHLNPVAGGNGAGLARIADTLARVGLVDLARRARIIASLWITGGIDADIAPADIARCPWVTSAMLQRRLERCPDGDVDYWAAAMELRVSDGPHPSLVNETADIIVWSEQIYQQNQANARLSSAVGQAQAGWRELANLTSNEIRGLLTSLEVVTDLRRAGAASPPGLELALVHRVAALTTMTQLGASGPPPESEWPVEATSAAAMLRTIVEGSRPMFDWTGRDLVAVIDVDDRVTTKVHPGLFADMVRWLLISATTGSLQSASIAVTASTAGDRLRVTIMARTRDAAAPEQHRELGLGRDSTAHRAAVAILDSWGGKFCALYSAAGLDVTIELPMADGGPV